MHALDISGREITLHNSEDHFMTAFLMSWKEADLEAVFPGAQNVLFALEWDEQREKDVLSISLEVQVGDVRVPFLYSFWSGNGPAGQIHYSVQHVSGYGSPDSDSPEKVVLWETFGSTISHSISPSLKQEFSSMVRKLPPILAEIDIAIQPQISNLVREGVTHVCEIH